MLSRFNRKWRWGEKEKGGGGGGGGKSKSETYLSEFCAHQDEEAEGQELAGRLHGSHPGLGTSHTDHRPGESPRADRCLLGPLLLLLI